jgi:ABC-2 type transport system ATP-binding protein
MTTAISVAQLCKRFRDNPALAGLSLACPSGSIFALVGPDGAGKTTLLRILAGILDYDSGEIEVFGENYRRGFEAKKAMIGYMPQRFGLYEDLTVQENIDFFADLFGVRGVERTTRIERLLAFSRMDPFTDRLAGQLSGGMKQKLGLACALIHNPRILLLDEPTNGVDPVSRREFWKLLYDLNSQGTTVMISSPYMDEAERAGYFALMSKGRLIASGIPSEERHRFKYVVYELQTDRAREVKERLSSRGVFRSVNLFGNSVHIVAENSVAVGQVQEVLTSAGIETTSLRVIVPTFEDIYIGLATE